MLIHGIFSGGSKICFFLIYDGFLSSNRNSRFTDESRLKSLKILEVLPRILFNIPYRVPSGIISGNPKTTNLQKLQELRFVQLFLRKFLWDPFRSCLLDLCLKVSEKQLEWLFSFHIGAGILHRILLLERLHGTVALKIFNQSWITNSEQQR